MNLWGHHSSQNANQKILTFKILFSKIITHNPIPTSQGRNQPLYEHHVTKLGIGLKVEV